jgi:hypothetical protein
MNANSKMFRVTRVALAASLAAACALGTTPALAQQGDQPAVSAQDKKKAQAHFDKGAEYYLQERYARAIVEFRKGYESYPEAMFLYNIALAQAKLGQHDKALATSERAAEGLKGKTKAANAALGAACTVALGAPERAEAMAEAANQARAEAPTKDARPDEKKDPVDEAPALEADEGLGALGWTGTAMLVVGGAALAGAGWTSIELEDDWAAYEEAGADADSARYAQLREDISSKQDRGQILLYSGAGLAVAGAALLTVDLMSGAEGESAASSYTLTPSVGAESVALDFTLAF